METWKIDNFSGVVKDVGFGKQPANTLYDTQNLVLDKKSGSLVTRSGYSTGLTPPAALTTLDYHLSKPVTTPSSIDQHLYFGKISAVQHVWAKPFYEHDSTASTTDNGWVKLDESLDLSSISDTDVTVNASPTNTLVIAHATSTWGLSSTSQYYKNWVIVLTTNYNTRYLVKSYTLVGATATFLLDTVVGINWVATPDYALNRYFHANSVSGNVFIPSYTNPSCYSNEFAMRFSGGQSSADGNKACWYGYLNKTFFPADATYKYTFQGSMAEVAECLAPSSAILLSSTIASAADSSTLKITDAKNYAFNTGATDWVAEGNHIINSYPTTKTFFDSVSGQLINVVGLEFTSTGAGDTSTPNDIKLTQSLTLTSGVEYIFKIAWNYQGNGTNIAVKVYDGSYHDIGSFSLSQATTDLFGNSVAEIKYTPASTLSVTKTVMFFANSPDYPVMLTYFNIYPTTSASYGLTAGSTYSFYATFVYDGYQESNMTYLGRQYLSYQQVQITNILRLRLGDLNKRITAVRLYVAIDSGNTTLQSNTTRISPAFFYREVSLIDSAYAWALHTATGYFRYTDGFTSLDVNAVETTWEQKTGRIETDSTSMSYSIMEGASGKFFGAQYYDYGEALSVTNKLRFTGFNGDGVACEDIFPNDPDNFEEKISSGSGVDIKALLEYQGDLCIWKDSSFLRLTTSEALYALRIIDNTIGAVNNTCCQKLLNGVIFGNIPSAYYWDGGLVRDLLEGNNKLQWQVYSATGFISFIDKNDRSFNVVYSNENVYKIKTGFIGLLPQAYAVEFHHLAVIKSGAIYASDNTGLSALLDTSTKDASTNISISANTGNITPVKDAFFDLRELRIDFTVDSGATISVNPTVTLSVDGSTLKAYSPTASVGNNYFRFNIPPHNSCRSFGVNFGGLSADLATTINSIELDYEANMPEFGDARMTA